MWELSPILISVTSGAFIGLSTHDSLTCALHSWRYRNTLTYNTTSYLHRYCNSQRQLHMPLLFISIKVFNFYITICRAYKLTSGNYLVGLLWNKDLRRTTPNKKQSWPTNIRVVTMVGRINNLVKLVNHQIIISGSNTFPPLSVEVLDTFPNHWNWPEVMKPLQIQNQLHCP